MCVVPKYGIAFNIESICNNYTNTLGDKMRPSSDTVEIEFFIEPHSTDENSENLLETCKKLIPDSAPLSPWVACILPNWKYRNFVNIHHKIENDNDREKRTPLDTDELKQFESIFSKDAFVILIVTSSPDINLKDIFKKQVVENIIKESKTHALNYIAPNLISEENQTALSYLKSLGISIQETREVVAGYLLHPAFVKGWKGNQMGKGPDKSYLNGGTLPSGSSVKKATNELNKSIPKDGIIICDHSYFNKRINELTNNIESYMFDNSLIQNKKRNVKEKVDTIPLFSIVSYFCGLGCKDHEISSQTIFSQLERFRNIRKELEFYNDTTTEKIEKDPFVAHRINKFTELIGRIGYDISSNQKYSIKFDGIDELIKEIEKDYNHIIQPAREAISNSKLGKINYLGLQELYRIGEKVISTKVGALNGIPVMYRITDAYYEQQRSMFGGKKFNFYLILETTVQVGREYVCVYFENVISNWTNEKEIHLLEYQLVKDEKTIPMEVIKYSEILKSLGGSPAYRKYSSGTFIPHQRKSIGGASSMKSLSSDGLMVIDTELGMSMNYHLISNVDSVGEAILTTMKDYLRLKKSNSNEQDTEWKRFQRYKSNGLQVYNYLPDELRYTLWPTVVAFSLTQKMWGYAILSGIESVTPSSTAWKQLVLPPATKEMLFATTAASLRGNHRINCGIQYDELAHDQEASYAMKLLSQPPRYKARDIVSTRGVGSLFLLYGSPGTGKTLTVESLARLFGRPLYSVSFAELGSNVNELEERLTDVLFLASHWGSLILLDEGDALVEKRKSGQLMLNSMTSILLRLLESFDGTLFITSNRAASFDPAALSRVTLAIRYKPLEGGSKEVVWKNALIRIFADEKIDNNQRRGENAAEEYVANNFDLNKLGQFKGSGRSVNAVIRLAIGLSDKRNESLSQKTIQDAIDVYTLFSDELLKECPEEWD